MIRNMAAPADKADLQSRSGHDKIFKQVWGHCVVRSVQANDFKALLQTAHDLADSSATVTLRHFRKRPVVDNKAAAGAFDPVTQADRGAERAMTRVLQQRYSTHGILGEEYGTRTGDGRFQWVLDPIDGTRAYIMGSPMWGTLIGLLDNGEPCLGIMDQPFTGERFWSSQSASFMRIRQGAPKRLKTRACANLQDAILTSTHPDMFEGRGQQALLNRLKSSVRMTRFGGDCYNVALLAAGYIDLVIEAGLKPYDIVALIPLVERAGGRVTTWDGKPATAGGNVLVSGDPRLHDAALAMMARG